MSSTSPRVPPSTRASAVAGQAAGEILRVDTLPAAFYGLDARPSWSGVGRLYVHGPSGNVAVGDISRYNDRNYPAQRLEVDGSALIHGRDDFALILDSMRYALDPAPQVVNLIPYFLYSISYILLLGPTPHTLYSSPYTLLVIPGILNPMPYIFLPCMWYLTPPSTRTRPLDQRSM